MIVDVAAWEFDPLVWRWSLRFGAAGPAGVAWAWIGDGVRVEVDHWSGEVLGIDVDASDAAGRRPAGVDDTLSSLVDTLPGAPTSGAVVAGRRRDEHTAAWSRRIRAADVAGVVDALGGPQRRATGFDLGRLAGLDARADGEPMEVAVDPSGLPQGVVNLGIGVRAAVDRSEDRLTVLVGVDGATYGSQLERVTAVVVDEVTDVAIAMGSLRADLGADGRPVGRVDLVVSGRRSASSLTLVLTDDPRSLPSGGLRRARAARHLALAATSAHRLGDPAGFERLSAASRLRQAEAGAGTALPLDEPPLDEPPFEVELAR